MINTGCRKFVLNVLVEKDKQKKMCLTLEPKILEKNLKHVTVTKQIKGKGRGEAGEGGKGS